MHPVNKESAYCHRNKSKKVNNSTLKVRQTEFIHHKAPNVQESQHRINILE